MHYKKTVVQAGRTMLVQVKAVTASGRNPGRAKKQNPTPQAVARYNEKMAERSLRLLLNTNFTSNDFHLTLTYKGEAPTQEGAKRELENFLKRARRFCKKKGSELRYVYVTEWTHTRIHHHIVMGGLTAKEAQQLWHLGHCHFTFLDGCGDYKGLADYLIKETKQSLRAGLLRKRWVPSRNLKKPKVKETIVKRWKRLEDVPKEYKHYALMDWDVSANPVTGYISQQAFYLRI